LVSILVFGKKKIGKYVFFFGVYLLSTYVIVPKLAPYFGRELLVTSELIESQSFAYGLTNRNYVRPEMNLLLAAISSELKDSNPNIKITCLDANFPFIDKFPLLPHLSHNDGKKLDISLIYESKGLLTSNKPSRSGYGVFEGPSATEYDQIKKCKELGKWQYDIQKYMTFGTVHDDIQFSEKGTKALLKAILNQGKVGMVFLEPHLRQRLKLTHSKIRFHGCQAVRHDDHIHLQLK